LEGYAFERQGRRSDYFHVGVDALLDCKRQSRNKLTEETADVVWQRFSQLLGYRGLNPEE